MYKDMYNKKAHEMYAKYEGELIDPAFKDELFIEDDTDWETWCQETLCDVTFDTYESQPDIEAQHILASCCYMSAPCMLCGLKNWARCWVLQEAGLMEEARKAIDAKYDEDEE